MISDFDRVENIAGKGENTNHQHFVLFPQCFQKAPFWGLLKVMIVHCTKDRDFSCKVCAIKIYENIERKKKLLLTSNFIFSLNVFFSSPEQNLLKGSF